jgi:predicted acyl esterase
MSEGDFEDVRPYIPMKKGKTMTDESSDIYDTIEWLLKNIKGHNGKAGLWGISYPGFYASMAAIDNHPALKAVSLMTFTIMAYHSSLTHLAFITLLALKEKNPLPGGRHYLILRPLMHTIGF